MSIALYVQVQKLDRLVAEHEARLAAAERTLRTLPPRASKPATEAAAFLTEILGAGPRNAIEVLRLAKERGIAERTLWRAKAALGVASIQVYTRIGGRPEYKWKLLSRPGIE